MAWGNNRGTTRAKTYSYQPGDVLMVNNTVTGFTVVTVATIQNGVAYGKFVGFQKGRFVINPEIQEIRANTSAPMDQAGIEYAREIAKFLLERQARVDAEQAAKTATPEINEIPEFEDPMADLAVVAGQATATPVGA